MEFAQIAEFMKNPGRALTRDYPLRTLWGYDYKDESHVVDTMVKRLRKKLGGASYAIKTVVSVGYKLEENP